MVLTPSVPATPSNAANPSGAPSASDKSRAAVSTSLSITVRNKPLKKCFCNLQSLRVSAWKDTHSYQLARVEVQKTSILAKCYFDALKCKIKPTDTSVYIVTALMASCNRVGTVKHGRLDPAYLLLGSTYLIGLELVAARRSLQTDRQQG